MLCVFFESEKRLKRPVAVLEHRHVGAVGANTGNAEVGRAEHEINVCERIVDSHLQKLLAAFRHAALNGFADARANGQMAGSIFVI